MKNNIFSGSFFIGFYFFFALSSAMEKQWHINSPSREPKEFLLGMLGNITENNDTFLLSYAPKIKNFHEYQQVTENFQKYTQEIKERKKSLEDEEYNSFTLEMLIRVSALVLSEYQKLASSTDTHYYNHSIYLRHLQNIRP